MPSETETLEALHAAYNAGDPVAASSLYAETGAHVDIAAGRPKVGRAAIESGFRDFLAAFPDAHWDVDVLASNSNHAFGRYVLTGSLQRDMWSFEARGQRLELAGVHVIECQDGQIARCEDYWDVGTFSRQMSIIPQDIPQDRAQPRRDDTRDR